MMLRLIVLSGDHPSVPKRTAGGLECWIHGPMQSKSSETRLISEIRKHQAVSFMETVNTGNIENICIVLESMMVGCNSFSFPTVQIEITSPMTGLVPFPLKPIRLKFGGEISAADRDENVVHIPVAKPGHDVRRISFQRLWDVLFDPSTCTVSDKKKLFNSIRKKLEL